MPYLRYMRARVRRFRLRASLRQWTLEFSAGLVPERLGLRQYVPVTDPDWDPNAQPQTTYARFRMRTRALQMEEPVLSGAPAKVTAIK
jgi:hypothetical protein